MPQCVEPRGGRPISRLVTQCDPFGIRSTSQWTDAAITAQVPGRRDTSSRDETLDQADALLFGRVTYEMMDSASAAGQPEAMPDWMSPFGRTIDAAKKYVVSSTLDRVDWNAELVRGDLGKAVQELKREPGKGLFVGGVKLPLALAELGLIDRYEFVVHPRLVGHGPTLFAGLSKRVDLKLVSRLEFGSGAVAMRYEPRASDSALALKRRTRLRSRAATRRSTYRSAALGLLGERAPPAGSRGRCRARSSPQGGGRSRA